MIDTHIHTHPVNMYCIVTVMRFVIILIKFYCMYVFCAVYFVYLFSSFTVLCVDCVFYCLMPSGVLNK